MDLNMNSADIPAFELSSYDPVRIHVPPASVTEQMIDAQLAREMERFAVVGPVEGPVAEGDNIFVDMQVTVNGKPAPELSGEKMSVMLLHGLMPGEYVENVVGMTKGESKSFDFAAVDRRDTSSVPDEFHVELTLLDAQRRTVPQLTDGFVATRLSATDKTVAEFREHVRAHLESTLQAEDARRREEAADAELASRLVGSVPDELIEKTTRNIVDQLRANLAARGMSLEQYFAQQGMNERQFQMSAMMQARESLRQGLALDALFRHMGYSLTEADVDRALAEVAPGNEERAKAGLEEDDETREYVLQMAARLKAHDWLVKTAVFE